jgi:type III secretion HrpO family protein
MQPEDILYLGKSTVMLIFYLSMPIIVAATVVGLIIALVQTLIQLQEQTLAFAAKLAVVVLAIFVIGDWMAIEMLNFQDQIFVRIGSP